MNQVCLVGRISSKELVLEKVGNAQTSKMAFNLAVSRDYKNSEGKYDADFPRIIAWKGTADYLHKYASKGTMIEVIGKIQTGSYNGSDGKMVFTTDIVANSVRIVPTGTSSQASSNDEPVAVADDIDDYADIDIADEDLPY